MPNRKSSAIDIDQLFSFMQCLSVTLPAPPYWLPCFFRESSMPYLEFLALLLADDDFGRQLAELGDEVVHANHSDVLGGYLRLANQECFCLSETGYLR